MFSHQVPITLISSQDVYDVKLDKIVPNTKVQLENNRMCNKDV